MRRRRRNWASESAYFPTLIYICGAPVTLLLLASLCGLPAQDWGYTTVRPGAHVFWWIYRGDQASDPNAPLVLWQQGGPGASSTGFGNFLEVGPVDVSGMPRNTSWTKTSGALLFIDNPVGSGFSYVDHPSLLTTTNAELASDYAAVLQDVLGKYDSLSKRPMFMFCESFGGHMVPAYATAVLDAVAAGKFEANLKGIALGDSWVSGVAYTDTWVPYLRQLSVLDSRDEAALQPVVDAVSSAVKQGRWQDATNQWGNLENAIGETADDVDWYFSIWHHVSGNEATPPEHDRAGRNSRIARAMENPLARRQLAAYHAESLDQLMNGPIRAKLNNKSGFVIPANVTWGGQSGAVFETLGVEFMKDVTPVVDALLKSGKIRVNVYQGALDLICCTPGTELWMKNLTWSGMQSFYQTQKTPIYPRPGDMNTGAFAKTHGILSMYYLTRSGHMAPGAPSIGGMPDTMFKIHQQIIAAGGP